MDSHAQAPPRKNQLVRIQSLRALAAFAVVLCHVEVWQKAYFGSLPHFPPWMIVGESGVDLFFVISGFIIMHVTLQPLNSWRHQAVFLLRRLARNYPAYWAVIIPMILALVYLPGALNTPNESHAGFFTTFFLLPDSGAPILIVAWTLVYEIYFYLVVSILFRWTGSLRLYLLIGWFVIIAVVTLLHPTSFANPYVRVGLSPLCMEFISGAILAYALRLGFIPIKPWIAGMVVAAVLILGFLIGAHHGSYKYDFTGRVFSYGIPAFFVLWMVVQMELQDSWRWIKLLAPMGDRSYSLYLVHVPIITIVFKLAARIFHHPTALVPFAAALISLGAIVVPIEIYYRWVEKPSHTAARRLSERIDPTLFSRRAGAGKDLAALP